MEAFPMNKVALITGANKGIGFETARQLGQLGITVLLGARDRERGEKGAEALRSEGLDAKTVLLDVTKQASIHAAAQEVARTYRKLDILINNAGILLPNAESLGEGGAIRPPSECRIESLRETFETNFFGAFMVTQAFLPLLRRSPAGRIVNVSSIHASLHLKVVEDSQETRHPLFLAYCASKTALNSLTAILANEFANTPIKVNSICPGYTDTDLSSHLGPKSPAEAAQISVHFATLPDDGPSGGFFNEHGTLPW